MSWDNTSRIHPFPKILLEECFSMHLSLQKGINFFLFKYLLKKQTFFYVVPSRPTAHWIFAGPLLSPFLQNKF